jgi:hypothetical protein
MYGFVLQDWITVRGTNAVQFNQNESDWINLSGFQDIVFWIDIREFTTAGTLSFFLQTAPTKDEVLFQTMPAGGTASSFTVAVASPIVPLPKVILASSPAVPLATWVRWALANSAASAWDITFRVLASANQVTQGAGVPSNAMMAQQARAVAGRGVG